MTVTLLLVLIAALVLIGLLAWAIHPPQRKSSSPDEILQTLAGERHYCRLPQILQSLQPEDMEFLRSSGHPHLVQRVRSERRRIALRYLELLHEDFASLLQAANVLAAMAPDLAPMQEWERLKLSLRFAFYCHYLHWKLRLGLAPWRGFGKLSEMASAMAVRLETAASRIGERAAVASEFPSLLE
jgi:hypothetical protein